MAESSGAAAPQKGPGYVVIIPNAIYTLDAAVELLRQLGLGDRGVRDAVRTRKLRAPRRSGKYIVTGEALLDWAGARRGRERAGEEAPAGG